MEGETKNGESGALKGIGEDSIKIHVKTRESQINIT